MNTLKKLITAMDPGADFFVTFAIDHSRTSLEVLSGYHPGPIPGYWVVKSDNGLICWDEFTNRDAANRARDLHAAEMRTPWNFFHYNVIRHSRTLVNVCYWVATHTRTAEAA